jgi:hypothetical protein
LPLKVEVVDGGLEVPVAPHGPGRFDVVLSIDGRPVASRRIGGAGSVSGTAGPDDFLDYTADLRAGRSRPGMRGGRR